MDRQFLLLLLCFLLSGFAALLYQTAWTREFSFIFGTSEIAVAVVLAGYMGGLALGSAIAARLAPRVQRPIFVYGALELAIALSALAVPFGLHALTAGYVALFQHDLPTEPGALASGFRLAGAFALMLVPTGLMGATLPLLARHAVRSEAEIGPRIGALYAINTAGAIGGTVCAAFVLLPALGLRQTVYVGAAVNGLVFLAAAALSRDAPVHESALEASRPTLRRWVFPLMLLSGAVSFSYEVMWTRLLSQLLGGSLFAFATMLSSFLLGITLGSAVGGATATTVRRAAIGLALAELGVAVFGISAFLFADQLPAISQALGAGWRASPAANAPLAAIVLLPVALCLGATFPYAVRLTTPDAVDTATATARVYAWNTVGAIIGAIGTGFVVLPALHFEGTATLGAVVSLAIAAAVALCVKPRLGGVLTAVGAAALALVFLPIENPWRLLTSSPFSGAASQSHVFYEASGRSSTVMLLDEPSGYRLYTNGLPESTIAKYSGMPARGKEARALTLLPVLLRPELERLLVIGLGGGVALEGVAPTVTDVDVIELEPEVVIANRKTSGMRALDPLADPRTRVVMNDARGALMLAQRKYDAIVSQPSHPWTAGASHLYTKDFFELVRDRLTPDGVFVQWIGLAFVDDALLRTLVATLAEVFPEVEIYRPHGPAILFVGSNAPLDILAGQRALAAAPEHFARNGYFTVEDVLAALQVDAGHVRAFAKDAPPNTDDWNLLASHSARIAQGLNISSFQAMANPFDALTPRLAEVDGVSLVRSLMRMGQTSRAHNVAASLSEPEQSLALGWIAGERRQNREANLKFARAFELAPGKTAPHDARVALGHRVKNADALGPSASIVHRAQRAIATDRSAAEALEGALAAIPPQDPLYEAALDARVAWRLASGNPDRAAEAIDLLDTRLALRSTPEALLDRAQAAHRVGRTREAWATVDFAIGRLRNAPRGTIRRLQALAQSFDEDALGLHVQARLEGIGAAGPGAR